MGELEPPRRVTPSSPEPAGETLGAPEVEPRGRTKPHGTLGSLLKNRDVRGALISWWLVLVGCSFVVGTPFLFVLDVLRSVPLVHPAMDAELLYEQLSLGPTLAGNLRPLAQSALLLGLTARAMVLIPTALAVVAVVLTEGEHNKSRRWFSSTLVRLTVIHFGRFLLTTALLQTVSTFLFLTLLTFALGWLATPRLAPLDVFVAVCLVGCAAFVYLLGFTLTDVSRLQLLRRGEAPFWVGIADGLEALTRRPLALLSVSARTGLLTAAASLTAPALATWMALAAPGTWGDLGAWVVAQAGVALVILIRVWGWNHLLSRLPPRSGLLDSSPTPPNRDA